MITYHIMTELEKEIISSWQYDGEYEIYNMPSYQEQKEKGVGFGDPLSANNFYTYYDENTLVGFTNILEEPKEVFMGIGIAPDICGNGYGQKILTIACNISKTLYSDKPIYLEVRTWNQRAIKCYENVGFRINGQKFEQKTMMGMGDFLRMVYNG